MFSLIHFSYITFLPHSSCRKLDFSHLDVLAILEKLSRMGHEKQPQKRENVHEKLPKSFPSSTKIQLTKFQWQLSHKKAF